MTENEIQFDGVQREYNWEEITPSFAVIESLAVFKYGTPDPTEEVLEAPLHDYIDSDGLNKVIRSTVPVTVEFTVSTYEVQISGNTVYVASAHTN